MKTNNAFLNSFYEIKESEIDSNPGNPAFRKATSNMVGAFYVCQKTLSILPLEERNSVSIIVATYFGEVISSLDFLTTLHEQNIAKPILFQNSLHNSTLGFISIQLGIQGPGFTISADRKTEQSVTNTAHSLLSLSDHVLICFVDIVPEYLKKNYEKAFPELQPHLGWARSFLLSKNKLTDASVAIDSLQFIYSDYLKTLKMDQNV